MRFFRSCSPVASTIAAVTGGFFNLNLSFIAMDMNINTQNYKRRLTLATVFILCASSANSSEADRPDIDGVWFVPWHSPTDPRWRLEDAICKGHCSKVGFEYLQALLDDPKNDDKSITTLYEETLAYEWNYLSNDVLTPSGVAKLGGYDPKDDPAVDCNPDGDGWVHQITAPVPFKIEQFDDRVVISYTYWNAVRTIYTDGRKPAGDGEPARLGHSVGRYEGSTLVVETTGIIPALTLIPSAPPGRFLIHGSETRFIERYSTNEDGMLNLEWTMIDPDSFKQPLVVQSNALRDSKTKLEEYVCEHIPGEF